MDRNPDALEPQRNTQKEAETVRKEILDHIRRGSPKLVILEETELENVIPTKFFLALKHATEGIMKHKTRFVLGGHRDKGKHSMVHTASTMTHSSVRLMVALASALGS